MTTAPVVLLLALWAQAQPAPMEIHDPDRPHGPAKPPIQRRLVLPNLITSELLDDPSVCAAAKELDGEKKLAVVFGKTHVCDFDAKVCLSLLRDLSDTCNTFLQSNFVVFHTRPYRNTPDHKVQMGEQDEAERIMDKWAPNGGPFITVIDLETCRSSRAAEPGIPGYRGLDPRPPEVRFELIQEALLAIPGVRERVSSPKPSDDPRLCLQQPMPSLEDGWAAVEKEQVR